MKKLYIYTVLEKMDREKPDERARIADEESQNDRGLSVCVLGMQGWVTNTEKTERQFICRKKGRTGKTGGEWENASL